MFSGIIEHKTKPNKIVPGKNMMRVFFPIPKNWTVTLGESINIDGVCSTVEKLSKNEFSVYYMPETLKKTSLSKISDSHFFNLEKCLTLQSLIGGHLVSGHVDTTAQVFSVVNEDESKTLTFKIAEQFTKYIIYKGSICINGVSLTIITVSKDAFSVSLIPYTLTHTNLGNLKKGDLVNIEVDLIAKYLEKLGGK